MVQTNSVPFHLFSISRIVKFIELESMLLDAGEVGRAKEETRSPVSLIKQLITSPSCVRSSLVITGRAFIDSAVRCCAESFSHV